MPHRASGKARHRAEKPARLPERFRDADRGPQKVCFAVTHLLPSEERRLSRGVVLLQRSLDFAAHGRHSVDALTRLRIEGARDVGLMFINKCFNESRTFTRLWIRTNKQILSGCERDSLQQSDF